MFYLIRNSRFTKLSIVAQCALFLITYMYVFGLDVTAASAQQFNEARPNISTFSNTVNNTASTYTGLTSFLSNGGNYNTTYSNYNTRSNFVTPNFNSSTSTIKPAQYTGVLGFIRGLFTGTTTNSVTTTTSNYGYTGTTYGTTNYNYSTPYATTYANASTNKFNQTNTTNSTVGTYPALTNTYSNVGRVYGQNVGGVVGGFLGGTMDFVNFVGGKIVYGGNRLLNGLTNATGNIATGVAYSTTGLVGTMGNVLGIGGRIILGAAKVALTIPILALKAGIFLTAVATVGTVRLLGAGLDILKSIVGTSATGVHTLDTNLTNLYNQTGTFGTITPSTTYQVGTTGAQNFNSQQFGQNVNNTYTYANTLQQNLTTNQGIANSIGLSAQKIKNDMAIDTKLAGLTIVELGKKLAYTTASLVSGSASQTSLVLGQSIQNIEYTKAQLKMIKAMNDSGTVNPYLCQQYIIQAKAKLKQANAILNTANQSISNSYLATLTNIQNTRNYLNQNNATITNQMNSYGTGNIYQQTIPYTTLNTYNSNVNYLNGTYSNFNSLTYATVPQQSTTFSNSATTSNTTGVAANTGLTFFDQSQTAERQNAATDTAARVTSAAPAATDAAATTAGTDIRSLQEKYTAAYTKYVNLAAAGDDKAAEAGAALEEYKKAYLDFQNALEITQNREASRK